MQQLKQVQKSQKLEPKTKKSEATPFEKIHFPIASWAHHYHIDHK